MKVLPVYNWSLCVSKSTHAGALPAPAYPYVDHHRSTEIHPVSMVPGPWRKQTKTVLGDSQQLILSGHDTGMMIPHLSPIMDNLMLPVTLISSSCTFPFVSFRRCAGKDKEPLVAFFPVVAPFIYCDDPEGPEKSGDKGKDGGDAAKPNVAKVNSDKLQQRKAESLKEIHPALGKVAGWAMKPRRTLDGAMDHLPSTRGVRHVQATLKGDRQKVQELGAKIGIRVSGRGRVHIPRSCTILLDFNFIELAMGWAMVLMSKALDAAAGAMLKPLKSNARDSLKRLDDDVALAVGSWAQRKQAAKGLYATIAGETMWKAAADGIVKSVLLDGKVKVPYGIYSYDFSKGKGSFLWWGTFESTPNTHGFKGVRVEALEALKGSYNPAVEDIIRDNPNYAAAPAGEE